ncbi:unnamed protein product [Paramecium primaurelia]|uniref:Choline transporter-like protein n=1 Tax=Paramecium primaurelia TaxID=5886 RepID=A0A8S1NDU1_PARPR|nr:unnamed protein product [Paramecium primaurelia]
MFQRRSEAGEEQGETVIALYSQQTNMSYIPPVYLKNGPNQNRSCTNLCCCLLFLLSIGALGYFYFLTYSSQHIERLYTPVDSEGRECGQGNLNKFPFIYFVTPEEKYLYRTVCVEKCPKKVDQQLLCAPNKVVIDCHNNPSPTNPEKRVLVYESHSYSGNICLPMDDNLKNAVQPAILVGEIQQALVNTKANLPIIAMSGGAAFLLAFFFTIMIGLCTTFIVYVFILVYISLTGFLSAYFLLYFIKLPLDLFPYFDKLTYAWSPYMLGASITFGLLCIYAIFTLCWNLRKMKFMISLVKLATTFLYQNKTIIIVPIVFFFLVMSTLLIWIASALAVLSEQQIDYSSDQQIYPFEKIQLKFDTLIKLMITILALIWLMQYILSLARFLNASTATLWYFHASSNKGFVYDSFKLAVRYHNGSITAEAIYSFFFSGISKAFNLIYDSLNRCRLKRHNIILNCFASISLCLCCLCENFIMYINNYAFVYIVMTSADYFESSKAVHFTIKRNYQDFETLSGLGEQFTHYSKMFIFLVTTLGTFIYVKEQTDFTLQLYTFAIIAFITLSIATLFMDMFGQSADALVLTYFTDCEVQKYHFGLEECGSCPSQIRDQVQHIREKQKIYYG